MNNYQTGVKNLQYFAIYNFIPESYLQKISQFISQKDLIKKIKKQKIDKVK